MKSNSLTRFSLLFGAGAMLIGICGSQGAAAQADRISLAGRWQFRLDRRNAGIEERWFERSLPDGINLPGSLSAQGIGDDVSVATKWTGSIVDKSWFTAPEYAEHRKPGNVKVPFWLQPEKYYAGAAWYQREIEFPPAWRGRRIVLTLERPHWETRVWVDGEAFGSNRSLSTPHEYDLSTTPAAGKHRLTIRVDNSLVVDVGENSHCISDHTQGNWNGIVGDVSLRATAPVWIEDVQVYPNVATRSVRVVVTATNAARQRFEGKLSLFFERDGKAARLPVSQNLDTPAADLTTKAEATLAPDAPLWDEFTPSLHTVRAQLRGEVGGQIVASEREVTFGLRQITTDGTQFLINGRKTFFRGTLECCIFPLTGHPPTEVESWKRIIRIAKAYGLNLIRFHSYCPPEAAFVAADELGFYYQVETCWPNQSTSLGDGKPVDRWVYDETDRILKAYGNHPSFVLMPHGNEPGGQNAAAYLAKWVEHFKTQDPRRLWSSGAGWPQLPENQFHVTPDPRVQHWGAGLKSRINAQPPETQTDYRDYIQKRTVPVISHEIGQWCVYPNFDEISKYRGCLKPKNFEIFRQTLRAHGMGDLAHRFLLASGKLQTLCYKEDIESALRTPGMGGFQLLDLHDFPGQGTALVGVLDPFWDEKGYVTAKEYSRFCNRTVPLARLGKRVFTTDEKLEADIEVAHFGPAPLKEVATTWTLVGDDQRVVAGGELPVSDIAIGNGIGRGRASIDLQEVPAPARYRLVVTLNQPSRGSAPAPEFQNDWDVWVYPPKVDTHPLPDSLVTEVLDDRALAALEAGGKVLLMLPPNRVKGDRHGKVALGFSSIFWNTAWTRRQPPTTLGILCDPKHPALAEFPTDFHSNWQWWHLVSRAGAMILKDLPRELQPIVQVIDDWVTGRKLGLVFEAKVAKGRVLVCSIDLRNHLDQNPVARQMLHSLLGYMAGSDFNPKVAVNKDALAGLLDRVSPSKLAALGAKVLEADSEDGANGNVAANAIDGNPNTIWHTRWQPRSDPMPHHLIIDLGHPVALSGITYLPRQDGANGRIAECEIYCSSDPTSWAAPTATATWPDSTQLQAVRFEKPIRARYVKLVARSEVNGRPYASIAELDVLTDEQ
ncbi:MAG TPA: discoidin domain-containing protein [Candidatus Paceibacterota bacterium]|nr:discoidin domain-containing protein [Verrucomicrobiota bacterium]HSA08995.1 discoidin domain-containing protein [Candidatus Paceibacterota bacterium]